MTATRPTARGRAQSIQEREKKGFRLVGRQRKVGLHLLTQRNDSHEAPRTARRVGYRGPGGTRSRRDPDAPPPNSHPGPQVIASTSTRTKTPARQQGSFQPSGRWKGAANAGTRPCLRAAALSLVVAQCMLVAANARGQTMLGAPTISTVTAGNMSLTVSWEAPSDTGGSAITAYDLRWIEAAATDRTDTAWTVLDNFWTAGDLSGRVTGVSNGTEYDLQLRAVTAGGDGPWSAEMSGTPQIAAPTVTALVPSEQSITVAWTPTDQAATGDTVDYDVRWIRSAATDKSDSEWNVASGVGASPTHYIIGELTNGTEYDVQVRALINQEGTWSTSMQATPYEPAGSPKATQAAIQLNVPIAAEINSADDTDVFKLVLQQSTRLLIRTTSDSLDSECSLIDADSTTITNGDISGANDDGYLPGSSEQCVIAITASSDSYPATFYVSVGSDDDGAPYVLHVDAPPNPGNSIATATPIALDEVKAGGHSADDDADYVRLVLDETAYLMLTVYYPKEPRLKLFDSEGNRLGAPIDTYEVCPDDEDDCKTVAMRLYLSPGSGDRYVKIEPPDDTDDRRADYYLTLSVDTEYPALLAECRAESRPEGVADELSGCQWHLDNRGHRGGTQGEDANVAAAHAAGYLGQGVHVAVIDDGVDHDHPDLSDNIDATRSHSYCGGATSFADTGHGTAVAGLVAARDNSQGVRGVAPRAQLRSYRLLGCPSITDADTAAAMTRDMATVAVMNNSWTLFLNLTPSPMPAVWHTAVKQGVTSGFGGKGVSYVWSAGNGARFGENSNFDEATNSYTSITACAVDASGEGTTYSSNGSNLWVCAPSHGSIGMPQLTTTALHGRYRTDFGGTSGAAPTVTGVVALMRAANTDLTWRDVKLILAGSARRNDADDDGWAKGARQFGSDTDHYWFNHRYGFGVVDALAAVQLAVGWSNVPTMISETVTSSDTDLAITDDESTVTTSVTLTNAIEFVEHVEIDTTFSAAEFRSLKVELVSPSGATSVLAPSHSRCCEVDERFRFGSSRHLGEPAQGDWTLKITDEFMGGDQASLKTWGLTLRGHRLRPTAPAAPSVSAGAGTLTITWTAPARAGASPTTGYDIRYIPADATDRSDLAWRRAYDVWTSGTLTHTLSGLGARAWDVQVRAKNSDVVGPWSADTEATPTAGANAEPYFSPVAATRSVAENTAANTSIGSAVAAIDDDTGATLTYSLGGTDASHFNLDTSSGQLKTKSALDYEDTKSYSVTVSVHDGKNSSGEADTSVDDTVDVTINVTDVNEPPTVTEDCDFTVEENTGSGWQCAFTASDPEMTGIQWSQSGPDVASFNLSANDSNAELQTRSGLQFDHETKETYSVALAVTDEDGQSATHNVTLSVTNVDEPGTVEIPQGDQARVGTQMEAQLSDPDGPTGESWQWQRRSDTWQDIPAATSRFYTPVDDDEGLALRVKVSYTDDEFGAEELTSPATREVAPPPNEAPAFVEPPNVCRLNEDRPPGVVPECAPRATDRNDDPISYQLDGGQPFTVDPQTGLLSLDGPLDHETREQHQFDIIASDGLLEGRATITIEVIDVDEPGSVAVEFESSLRPGANLTASVSDEDCPQSGCDAQWEWQRSTDGLDWSIIASAASYTIVDADACRQLRVRAAYTDSHGPQEVFGTPGTEGEVVQRLVGSCFPQRRQGGGGGRADPEEERQQQPVAFADVDPSNIHAAHIAALVQSGITVGCSTNPPGFCPNQPVTRAQMATFLARALSLQVPSTTQRFADVDLSSTHAAHIAALVQSGITVGCSTNPPGFCPNQPVTRAQMATFLARALSLQVPSTTQRFADVDLSNTRAEGSHAISISARVPAQGPGPVGCWQVGGISVS